MIAKETLLGRWDLVAFEKTAGERVTGTPLGPKPSGFILYSADGTMAAFLHRDPALTWDGPLLAAYGGPWEIRGDEVHHHVAFNTDEERAGTVLVRRARIEGGRLILETPPKSDKPGLRISWKPHA